MSRSRWRVAAPSAVVVLFALHALNYGYFFVDDEAIAFVYAQNVLDGHGLAYNPDDGRAEGYSNLLSVGLAAVLLGLVTLTGGGKLWALALAQLFAFVCAVGVIVVSWRVLARLFDRQLVPVAAGMTFLVLAGPLAVWSSSGLETTLFALIVAVLVGALLDAGRSSTRNDGLIVGASAAALLCRTDGFVWVGAFLLALLVSVPAPRRREIAVRVVLPSAGVFAAYHGWRVWYFGDLLPLPAYAKVLYKLGRHETLVIHHAPAQYVIAFLGSYAGIPAAVLVLALAARRDAREVRLLGLATLLIAAYLWIVGDWMFGFRFFVALLLPLAILAAYVFSAAQRRWRRGAAAALVPWAAALGWIANGFFGAYTTAQGRGSWLAHPSLNPAKHFAPYYEIYLKARAHVAPGDTIAFNQAGFVPFMLSARNVDDLGICTPFFAKLPTTDVVFTEVGRLSPLTGGAALSVAETYLLARAPRLLITPSRHLRAANRGAIPDTVLGGAYRLLFTTAVTAAYAPAERLGPRPALRPLTNLAHVSTLRQAWLNGRVLAPSTYRTALPYLYGRTGRLRFEGQYVADFRFSDGAEDVYEIHIASVRSREAATITLTLQDGGNHVVYRTRCALRAGRWRRCHGRPAGAVKAASLLLTISPEGPGPHLVDLHDVRVQGQTAVLRRFLEEHHAME